MPSRNRRTRRSQQGQQSDRAQRPQEEQQSLQARQARVPWTSSFVVGALAFALIFGFLVHNQGCLPAPGVRNGDPDSNVTGPSDTQSDVVEGGSEAEDDPAGTATPSPAAFSDSELADMRVNEMGQVMVIMYHDVRDYEDDWVRSRENFRKDLERFNELGYTLVPFNDYLDGSIEIPAGRSPLVLTFDDGTKGQLNLIDSGLPGGEPVVDPDCAVGILLQFAEEHPDFGKAATFYVHSGNHFGAAVRAEEYLTFLKDNGMEIGNHTWSHANLSAATPSEIAQELGSLANRIKDICGYEVASLALPYGGYPQTTENLLHGVWEGRSYENKGVLLVGAEPAPSPFSKDFNPLAIPRIRGSQPELDKWLSEFEKHPGRRFFSDGDGGTVTVPEEKVSGLDTDRVGDRTVRDYATEPSPGS